MAIKKVEDIVKSIKEGEQFWLLIKIGDVPIKVLGPFLLIAFEMSGNKELVARVHGPDFDGSLGIGLLPVSALAEKGGVYTSGKEVQDDFQALLQKCGEERHLRALRRLEKLAELFKDF